MMMMNRMAGWPLKISYGAILGVVLLQAVTTLVGALLSLRSFGPALIASALFALAVGIPSGYRVWAVLFRRGALDAPAVEGCSGVLRRLGAACLYVGAALMLAGVLLGPLAVLTAFSDSVRGASLMSMTVGFAFGWPIGLAGIGLFETGRVMSVRRGGQDAADTVPMAAASRPRPASSRR